MVFYIDTMLGSGAFFGEIEMLKYLEGNPKLDNSPGFPGSSRSGDTAHWSERGNRAHGFWMTLVARQTPSNDI